MQPTSHIGHLDEKAIPVLNTYPRKPTFERHNQPILELVLRYIFTPNLPVLFRLTDFRTTASVHPSEKLKIYRIKYTAYFGATNLVKLVFSSRV